MSPWNTELYSQIMKHFAKCCKEFSHICHLTTHTTDMLSIYELSLVASSENPYDLQELFDLMMEIQDMARLNINKLHSIKLLLVNGVLEQCQQSAIDTNELERALQAVRFSANFIPLWVPEAKEVKYAASDVGEDIIYSLKRIVNKSLKTLAVMNEILDKFPIDRTQDVYSKLPENESEIYPDMQFI